MCEPVNIEILDALKSDPVITFRKRFNNFAMWLYNESPFQYFQDCGKPLSNMKPDKICAQIKADETNPKRRRRTVYPLGIIMEEFKVTDHAVRSVDVSLEKLKNQNPDVDVWGVIKIKGKETVKEDWSALTFRNFCFDIPEEHLEKLTLIYVNHSETKKIARTEDLAEVKGYKDGCSAKVSLTWNLSTSTPAINGSDQIMSVNSQGMQQSESGSVAAVFRLKEKDPGFPEIGKKFVPYGNYTYTGSMRSGGSFKFAIGPAISNTTLIKGAVSGTWKGEKMCTKELAHLDLMVFGSDKPEVKNDEMQIAENMMPGIGGLFNQAKAAYDNLPVSLPKENELGYELTLEIHDIPATENNEQTTMDMETPVAFNGVFKKGTTLIPLSKTFSKGNVSITVTGTLKINKSISNGNGL